MPTTPPADPAPDSHARMQPLREEAHRLGLTLDEATVERFSRYLAMLLTANERAGLTAITDVEDIQRRHFGESLALLPTLREAGLLHAGRQALVADLGPGGGFPGVPMALAEPAIRLVMVEAQERRCAFLRDLVEALPVPDARVLHARAEEAGRDATLRARCDIVVARALAALPVLLEYALPLLREGGVLAAPKGSRVDEELEQARGALAALGGEVLDVVALPLPADAPPQRVVLVRRTGALDDRYPRRPGVPAKRPL